MDIEREEDRNCVGAVLYENIILRNMYAIRVRNVIFCHVYKQAMHQPWSTVDVTPDSQFVKELLRVRNNESYLCNFTINEISALIECVCVT